MYIDKEQNTSRLQNTALIGPDKTVINFRWVKHFRWVKTLIRWQNYVLLIELLLVRSYLAILLSYYLLFDLCKTIDRNLKHNAMQWSFLRL